MAIYEIIKKERCDDYHHIVTDYQIRRKFLGLWFYDTDYDDNPLSVILTIFTSIGLCSLLILYFILGLSLLYFISIAPLLYFIHFGAKKNYKYIDNAKKTIEYRIKRKMNKDSDVIIRYIQGKESVEAIKYLN